MILVDTSIWVDHLRSSCSPLAPRLQEGLVFTHDLVIGELACGSLANRRAFLDLISALPRLRSASQDECLYFIERHRLMGRGIGYIDAHLLAATALNAARLWTRDKRLQDTADALGLGYLPDVH